ncbi:unnamed protein product, partial [Prorocentrum cordatum]
ALACLAEFACEDPSHFGKNQALEWILKGQELFACSWDTVQIFPPKNVTDAELADRACIRSPDKVRVLGLRNCDLKIISAAVNHATRPALQALAPLCQRGFVPGRNFGVNILELDVSSRMLSVTPRASRDIPVLFSLGIMQGCPLSGTLHALGAAAFLVDLAEKVEGPQVGLIRACADDIGGALRSAQALSEVSQVMSCASAMANLDLKAAKCKVAPLFWALLRDAGQGAVTTLSYVAQLCWPPKSALHPELSVLAQVFRPPLGALHLDACTRAATLTFQCWPQRLARLRAHADEHPDWATLDMLAAGLPCPNFWKAPAFVENLEAHSRGVILMFAPAPIPERIAGQHARSLCYVDWDACQAVLRSVSAEFGCPMPAYSLDHTPVVLTAYVTVGLFLNGTRTGNKKGGLQRVDDVAADHFELWLRDAVLAIHVVGSNRVLCSSDAVFASDAVGSNCVLCSSDAVFAGVRMRSADGGFWVVDCVDVSSFVRCLDVAALTSGFDGSDFVRCFGGAVLAYDVDDRRPVACASDLHQPTPAQAHTITWGKKTAVVIANPLAAVAADALPLEAGRWGG